MTQTNQGSSWKDHPTALVVAGALGGLLIAGGLLASGVLTSSDEAPIRVRGGSINLDVLHSTQHWERETPQDRKNWRIPDSDRSNDDIEVFIAPTTASNCTALWTTTKRVRFIYGNDPNPPYIEVKATGNHTKVSSRDDDLTPSGNDKTITLPTGGIRRIEVDNNNRVICDFQTADTGLRVLLIEP